MDIFYRLKRLSTVNAHGLFVLTGCRADDSADGCDGK